MMTDRQNHRHDLPADRGVIHGRFQILHNDHLAYLLSGKALCRHLIVGITNPDPFLSSFEEVDPHRTQAIENPLTYYERYLLVQAALREAGLNDLEFSVVPLPINRPELYRHYVPLDALFFLTIYDPWGYRKLRYFESLNLKVHIIRKVSPDDKGLSGRDIRQMMLGDKPWQHLVPPSVAALLSAWGIPERLRRTAASDDAPVDIS